MQSFRSAPGPNAGRLDAEFEAFQAGLPLEAGYHKAQVFTNGPSLQAFGPQFAHSQASSHSQALNWAADFQNLHLNEARASPISQSQFHQHAPMQRSAPGGWHQDFLHQQNQSTPYQPQQQHQRSPSGWAYGDTGGFAPQQIAPIAQQAQSEMQSEGNFSEAAFEQAFESARSEMQSGTQMLGLSDRGHENENGVHVPQAWSDQRLLGSDRILEENVEEKREHNEQDEADELSRTAGQLLENVSGDQSKKFQDSSFLSLMRQLRDKEVRVEGDKLVDVSMLSSTA